MCYNTYQSTIYMKLFFGDCVRNGTSFVCVACGHQTSHQILDKVEQRC